MFSSRLFFLSNQVRGLKGLEDYVDLRKIKLETNIFVEVVK